MKKWRCFICGYIHEGEKPPYRCPVCGALRQMFEAVVLAEPSKNRSSGRD